MKTKTIKGIPEDLKELWAEFHGLCELKKVYANKTFGFKKAKKLAIEAEKKRFKFWREIWEYYAEERKGFDSAEYITHADELIFKANEEEN